MGEHVTTTRHSICLGDGKRVPVGEYLRGVRHAIANPGATFRRSLMGTWPATGAEIRREFFEMVADHCNRGLCIADRRQTDKAIARRYKAGVLSRCRWCGAMFPRHNPNNDFDRFCTAECRKEYWQG